MDKKVLEEKETEFAALLAASPRKTDEMLAIIADMPPGKGEELTALMLQTLSEDLDFNGTLKVIKTRLDAISAKLRNSAIRDTLRKATKDRLVASFVDSCGFDAKPVEEAIARLERLLVLKPGTLVLSPAWGLGEIRRLDYFYRKITIDFKNHRGQQMTFPTACDTLSIAPENHVLVIQKADPDRIAAMLRDKPGEFVKLMLQSYGDLTLVRLEELMVQNSFVKAADWKKFWEAARAELKKDKLVDIPVRRAEPVHLKEEAESYGDTWFTAFASMTDPKQILASVRTLDSLRKVPAAGSVERGKVEDRMAFAVKGARLVDDALYAQLACTSAKLDLANPAKTTMRAYLWEHERYLEAARLMPAREVGDLIAFLSDGYADVEARARLIEAMPRMCFQLLSSFVEAYRKDPLVREAAGRMLRETPPATLVTYVLGRYGTFGDWKELPGLQVILGHAIALGEGRQNGEKLRMQNIIRRLFADEKWLARILEALPNGDRESFFERFQASIAWDPSTHNLITMRMVRLRPELAGRVIKRASAAEAPERITSFRSYAERKAQYLELINVTIPKNAHDIEVARSYGDLRENFEYQSAKDEQRALMQKQTLMQADLNAVKPVDFADVAADEVRAGTTVELTLADGTEREYTILGEWDNDLEKNIIANRTRLAQNLIGRKAGDAVELADAEGRTLAATVKAVKPLSDAIRQWAKLPDGMSI